MFSRISPFGRILLCVLPSIVLPVFLVRDSERSPVKESSKTKKNSVWLSLHRCFFCYKNLKSPDNFSA